MKNHALTYIYIFLSYKYYEERDLIGDKLTTKDIENETVYHMAQRQAWVDEDIYEILARRRTVAKTSIRIEIRKAIMGTQPTITGSEARTQQSLEESAINKYNPKVLDGMITMSNETMSVDKLHRFLIDNGVNDPSVRTKIIKNLLEYQKGMR